MPAKLVFGVAPAKILAFAKGEFAPTRLRFSSRSTNGGWTSTPSTSEAADSRIGKMGGGDELVDKGDRVIVESEKVGVEPRSGVITGVHGTTVQVRWDDGHETTFVPAAGAMKVEHNQSGEAS